MFGQKDTYCFVVFTEKEQSVLFSVSASPPLAVHPQCFHLGVVVTRVLQNCTVVCTLRWGGVRLTSTLAGGRVLLWRMDEGGRVGNDVFFLFVLFFFVELVQGFHRCIKICTVLFTFSWFGYRN